MNMETLQIHETAIINPGAQLGQGVVVGPYSVIDGNVKIGDNVVIGNSCLVTGNTEIGRDCRLFTGAVIGSFPQDKKFVATDDVRLRIGERNIFREYVTVNAGTVEGGGVTSIGSDNLLMAYAHVAHDCHVGNHCIMANVGTLGGHVTVGDHTIVGGLAAVHQFVRLGRYSIIGGGSKVAQDLPPFAMCDGHPAKLFNINIVGLRRAQFSPDTLKALRRTYKILFHSGLAKPHAIERVRAEVNSIPEIEELIEFVQTAKRGVCG
jgi:UDP-N-acetylglucosamine acyltransferase